MCHYERGKSNFDFKDSIPDFTFLNYCIVIIHMDPSQLKCSTAEIQKTLKVMVTWSKF